MQTISDKQGKSLFKEYIERGNKTQQYQFTESDTDKVDCTLTAYNGTTSAVELKYRKNYTSDIIDNGVLLEWDKFQYLKDTIEESGYTNAYYISIFSDGIMAVFDVLTYQDSLKWIEKDNLPTHTEFANTKRKTKKITLIPRKYLKCRQLNI